MKKIILTMLFLVFFGLVANVYSYDTCVRYHSTDNPNPTLPCSYNGYDYDSLAVEYGAYVNSLFYKGANYILTDHDWYWSLLSQTNETCDGFLYMDDGDTYNCSHQLTFNKNGALFFGAGPSYKDLNAGLVGYWKFDNSSNLGLDSSTYGNNGTPASGYVSYSTEGKIGGAAKFIAGSNSGITIPNADSLNFTGGITVSAWVNLDVVDGHATVISKSDSSSNEPYALWASFYHFDGRIGAFFSGADRSDDSGTLLPASEWVHVAMTYDGLYYGIIKFFVNGALVNSMPSNAHGITTNNSALHIGASPCPGPEDFSGLMDEVRLYNRALSEAEIQELYGFTPPSPQQPNIEITPSTLDFQRTRVRQCSVPPSEFTLSNTGKKDLIVSDISLSNIENFTLLLDGGANPCNVSTPTISPGSSCTVAVTFCPSTKGNKFVDLTVTSNDPDTATFNVALSGTTLNHGWGWVVTIDGMDPWSSAFNWPNPTSYLSDAITDEEPYHWRSKIINNVGPILPFIWTRNTGDTATTVHQLYEHIKYLNSTNRPVVILAHSWGTVLAYIALHKHGDIYVDELITLGSPLDTSNPPVFSVTGYWLALAGIFIVDKPENLGIWHNYLTKCDPISAPILTLSRKDNFVNKKKYYVVRPIINELDCHRCYFEDSSKWNKILQDVIKR